MNNALFILLVGVIVIAISAILFKTYEYFASSPVACAFKTLGTYKLSTNKSEVLSSSSKGLMYISDLTSWSKITYKKSDDETYSYTDFSPLDLAGVNVKSIINKVMICNKVPEFSATVGVNTEAALILCLQSNTTPGSRVFFVKCFVPRASASDSNSIVGEIGGNTIATYHDDVKPVAVIQGGLGVPNTTDTYTLSYTICAASSRPPGFAYSDCCTSILDTASVTSIAMVAADITKADGTQCTDSVPTNTPNSTDTRYSGLGDSTCARGKYSVVTGGVCTGTIDTDAYLLAVKSSTPTFSGDSWRLGGSNDEYGAWFRRTHDASGNLNTQDDSWKSWHNNDYWKLRNMDNSKKLTPSDIAKLKALSENKKPNELSWPQKYNETKPDPKATLKPGLSECQKYYNCKKKDDDDDYDSNDYEGEC